MQMDKNLSTGEKKKRNHLEVFGTILYSDQKGTNLKWIFLIFDHFFSYYPNIFANFAPIDLKFYLSAITF